MKRLLVFAIIVSAVSQWACGAPIISNTWDSVGDLENWDIVDEFGGASYGGIVQALGPGPAGYLSITGAAAGSVVAKFDRIYNTDVLGGAYTNLAAGQRLLFDFYAAAIVPDEVNLYFIGDAGQEWRSIITVGASGWSTGVGDSLIYDGSWYAMSGVDDAATFFTAMGNVSEVGLLLEYQYNVGGQEYGIDYFHLDNEPWPDVVPEPSTYAMLGTVFISLGITFRRKLNDSIGALKKNLKS